MHFSSADCSSYLKFIETHLIPLHSPLFFRISDQPPSIKWMKPYTGWPKVNCDGAWVQMLKEGGVGCVARDSEWVVFGVSVKYLDYVDSTFLVEFKALWEAYYLCCHLSFQKVIRETDCFQVFESLQYGVHENLCFLKEAFWLVLLSSQSWWFLVCIRREANIVVDLLTSMALNGRICRLFTSLDRCPLSLG